MKGDPPRSSTDYVREFRERMRNAGLVKKDVWIRPEHAGELTATERRLRQAAEDAGQDGPVAVGWTIDTLEHALRACRAAQAGWIEVERLEGAEPALRLAMRELGDLPILVAIGGQQIIVEALMWPLHQVIDPAAYNAHVLRTHKRVPLSSVGIESIGGTPCYIMFGALDVQAQLATILFEIETLAENVIASVEAHRAFLREDGGTVPPAARPGPHA